MGAPSKFTGKLANEICRRLATGESLRAICRSEGMPNRDTVNEWVANDIKGFSVQYARARDKGLDMMADETLAIADDGENDWMASNDPDNPGYKFNGEHYQRSRLRVDTRKWYLSKLAPKRYGEKLTAEFTGKDGEPLAGITINLVKAGSDSER
jgi:hypothetical protein